MLRHDELLLQGGLYAAMWTKQQKCRHTSAAETQEEDEEGEKKEEEEQEEDNRWTRCT